MKTLVGLLWARRSVAVVVQRHVPVPPASLVVGRIRVFSAGVLPPRRKNATTRRKLLSSSQLDVALEAVLARMACVGQFFGLFPITTLVGPLRFCPRGS